MITVKRANVILTIENDEVDKYLEKGYDVIDGSGKVVQTGAPKNIGALQIALQQKDAEIAELKKEIERLKASSDKEVSDVDTGTVSEEPKKKSSYKRKAAQE